MSEISVVDPPERQKLEGRHSPSFREDSLPPEGPGRVPAYVWITVAGVLIFSFYYLGRYLGDFGPYPWLHRPDLAVDGQTGAGDEVVDGAQVYAFRCAACHQQEGTG